MGLVELIKEVPKLVVGGVISGGLAYNFSKESDFIQESQVLAYNFNGSLDEDLPVILGLFMGGLGAYATRSIYNHFSRGNQEMKDDLKEYQSRNPLREE